MYVRVFAFFVLLWLYNLQREANFEDVTPGSLLRNYFPARTRGSRSRGRLTRVEFLGVHGFGGRLGPTTPRGQPTWEID